MSKLSVARDWTTQECVEIDAALPFVNQFTLEDETARGNRISHKGPEKDFAKTLPETSNREDNWMMKKDQKDLHTIDDEEVRVRKGKMHESILPLCSINEIASLQSQSSQDEEVSSETNAVYGDNPGNRDTSPTAFTKVRKKKGGKGKKEASRL
ncbi:hypothetical protein SADUNF_Sadunf17G0055800 [Salix dunnii]|uniref:Uncharacterized protein n=1 Tax=Salix dunnii TaxID=1413687 RepID=A0A835J7K3_9ROSI|nr:hypothetical protein SADUNF_Sadunf17G0055800 [Salix dunnii]